MAVSTVSLQAQTSAKSAVEKAAGLSSSARIQPAQVSLPCRPALVRKRWEVVQAKVKRKAEVRSPAEGLDASAVEALRAPWVAVAAATALATLGASDQATPVRHPEFDSNIIPLEAAAASDEVHSLSAASLSAPLLVFGGSSPDADGARSPQPPEVRLFYQPAEPLQPAFNPDDFRAKLPDGSGSLGGGEWQFSATKTSSRSCPAWGSNQNIEMVVPGAAKALQPHPPRGSKRWFASFPGADMSQLQGGAEASALEDTDWEYLQVDNPAEESASPKEGAGTPEKNPFEGLIIEIVRMPVFSCFSL